MQERDSRKDDDKFLGDACGNSGNNAKRPKTIGKPLGSHWKAIGYTGKLYDVPNFKCGNVCSLLFTDI